GPVPLANSTRRPRRCGRWPAGWPRTGTGCGSRSPPPTAPRRCGPPSTSPAKPASPRPTSASAPPPSTPPSWPAPPPPRPPPAPRPHPTAAPPRRPGPRARRPAPGPKTMQEQPIPAPPPAGPPVIPAAVTPGSAARDIAIITRRNLRRIARTPQLLVFTTIQPVLFVLLFVYVFGGAIRTPGMAYVDYLLPGIFVQTV